MKIQTRVRLEEEFYQEAKKVFKKVGLTFGDAVNLFLSILRIVDKKIAKVKSSLLTELKSLFCGELF